MRVQLQMFCNPMFINKLKNSQSAFTPPTGENITKKRDELTGQYFHKDRQTGRGTLSPEHRMAIMRAFGNDYHAAFEHQRKLEGSVRMVGDYRMVVMGVNNSDVSILNGRTGEHRIFTNTPNAKAFLRSLDGDLQGQLSFDLFAELLTDWIKTPATNNTL